MQDCEVVSKSDKPENNVTPSEVNVMKDLSDSMEISTNTQDTEVSYFCNDIGQLAYAQCRKIFFLYNDQR